MFEFLKRKFWKGAVTAAFHDQYGVNLDAIGRMIGPNSLDDLITVQYHLSEGNPQLGAQNINALLIEKYSVDASDLARRFGPQGGGTDQ